MPYKKSSISLLIVKIKSKLETKVKVVIEVARDTRVLGAYNVYLCALVSFNLFII